MLKDPKAKWIGETRRMYSSYTLQAWEVFASSILWCYSPPCCSLASRSNSKRPGTILVDVSNWKVNRSFDAFINCIFPTWYKITFCAYFFLVGTLENWKDTFPTELDQKVRLQRLTFLKLEESFKWPNSFLCSFSKDEEIEVNKKRKQCTVLCQGTRGDWGQ